MTTIGTITDGHFHGGRNLNAGQRHNSDAVLEEFLEQVKVDVQALEAFQAGLRDPKDSVRLATDAALNACTAAGSGVGKTLTQDTAAVENIDGAAVAVGDRILVKNQVAGKDNGIYTVTTVGTVAVKQVLTRATDADSSAEVTAGMVVPVAEGTANADKMFMLTTNDTITLDTTSLTFGEITAAAHASDHIRAGDDEIDADQLDIDMTPSNYSPDTTPAEVDNADHLSAHLYGIDLELFDVAQAEGSAAVVQAIQAGQPLANDTLTVGSDVYEADGAGANINFVIAGSAEGTLDNLLAAAVASGTENLYWDKLSATVLRLRAADGPQGNIIGSDPSIVLDASSMTNWSFDVGDVNMNTLAGKAAAKQAMAAVSLTITAAMITAGSVRVSFPFTPTKFNVMAINASGALELAITDTFAISGDDIVITLGGAGGDLADTDVVHLVAYA